MCLPYFGIKRKEKKSQILQNHKHITEFLPDVEKEIYRGNNQQTVELGG